MEDRGRMVTRSQLGPGKVQRGRGIRNGNDRQPKEDESDPRMDSNCQSEQEEAPNSTSGALCNDGDGGSKYVPSTQSAAKETNMDFSLNNCTKPMI